MSDRKLTDGKIIPGKYIFDFSTYEYYCDQLGTKDVKEIEELLDLYGHQGWELSGFIVSGGQTKGFCVVR